VLTVGAAHAIQVRGTKQVAVAFGGDGATNNGWYYGGLRNAALHKLPFIAVVENNGYQVATPLQETSPLTNLHEFGAGLRIPHEAVNGMDVTAVYAVATRAVERARAGEGPTIIETKTYRYYDHLGFAGAKPGKLGAFGLPYRSDSEVYAWLAEDPIPKLRRQMVLGGVLTDQEADKIEAGVKQAVADSIEFARKSPAPSPETGLKYVYGDTSVRASQLA
jgi:acetoin:2,6-dichlorophenolindophenol oxidoreductase subunit alpha